MHKLRNLCHSFRTASLWAWNADTDQFWHRVLRLWLYNGVCWLTPGTWMVALAGCLSSMSRSPSSWSLLTSLSWASRLLFLKCWWTLELQGSSARFMNRHINIFCGIGGNWTCPSQPHLSGVQCSGGVLFRGVAGPHTACGCRAGPPCGHSSPASWSCPAPHPRSSVPSDCRSYIHAGFSGNGHATWSCPERRVKKSKVQKTSQCPATSSFVF